MICLCAEYDPPTINWVISLMVQGQVASKAIFTSKGNLGKLTEIDLKSCEKIGQN